MSDSFSWVSERRQAFVKLVWERGKGGKQLGTAKDFLPEA